MKRIILKRRDFLKKCLAAATAVGSLKKLSSPRLFFSAQNNPYDAKGLPTRLLGKTGVKVPLIAIGCGSRFCAVEEPERSVEILQYALDNGFFHWDTAHDYASEKVISEERLGLVLKDRRQEVFLASKTSDRTYSGTMRQLEESLKRLQTDRLDLYQIHSVQSREDVDRIGAKDGVLKALQKLKEEKVTRFIGFSGHLSAEVMSAMVARYDFDTMLIALNHYEERVGDMEKGAIPAASGKGMGILAMKVIRPREKVEGIVPEQLIRYALSLEYVHAAVIGTDSVEVVRKNITLLKNFDSMSSAERQKMGQTLRPFFKGDGLSWMAAGYRDGEFC